MTLKTLLEGTIRRLEESGIEEASTDARIMLEEAFHMSRSGYILHMMDEANPAYLDDFFSLVNRREAREPLQYILGKAYFMGFEFKVTPDVLIPRFDTEVLVENALKMVPEKSSVLDMCTGSGCIGISMALLGKNKVTAADLSEKALQVAAENAKSLGADINFIHSDMFDAVNGSFDAIVSNPPYIETSVIEGLACEVKDGEPYMALDGGKDGLDFYRILAAKSADYLKDKGLLIMEIGYNQGEAVSSLLEENGFTDVRVIKDLAGLDRVVCGWRK